MASNIIHQSHNLKPANEPAWPAELSVSGFDPDRFAASLENMPRLQFEQFSKFLTKLNNKDPRTLRLAEMFDRGEMSGRQLLSLM